MAKLFAERRLGVKRILPTQSKRKSRLESTKIANFGGGLYTNDKDDGHIQPRYLVTLNNWRRTASGAQEVRFGNKFIVDVKDTVSGSIVDGRYFNGKNIIVTATGEIAATAGGSNAQAIWNNAIAGALPGSPSGWASGIQAVNFVPFKDKLIIHNGVDKPVIIDSLFAVKYVQDEATGSNVNVPIGRYGCTVGDYHVVAGIPLSPTELYIASKGTSGVFPGDAAPNDSITFDVGAFAPEGGAAIRGIAGFRSFLIVFFLTQSLVIELGTYDENDVHVPKFNDTMPTFGIMGHRAGVSVGNDYIFADLAGVNSAKRNLFSGLVETVPLSDLIGPTYQAITANFTDTEILEQTWAVHDSIASEVLLFMPDDSVIVYSSREERNRYRSWSLYQNMDWTCGWRSALGRVFFASGSRIYQLGNYSHAGERWHADKLNDRDGEWANSTAYIAGNLIYDVTNDLVFEAVVSHTSAATDNFEADRIARPDYWVEYTGQAIDFELETPWIEGRQELKVKLLHSINAMTKGTAQFTLKAYVDFLYKDDDDNIIHPPAVEMQFIGNQAVGFGVDEEPYGGGRRSGSPSLWKLGTKFKAIKFNISGSTKKPLHLSRLSFLFSTGRYRL